MKTAHAQKRAQQRGIPPLIDELLDLYGREQHDGRGGVILFLTGKAFDGWNAIWAESQSAVSANGCVRIKS